MKHTIVSVAWLNEHLYDDDLILLDVSPKSTVSGGVSSHQEWSIPQSRYVDLKGDFTKKESQFPNTVPDQISFQNECRKLGINQSSKIVVYDNLGIYTSPRLWWLFKIMGHTQVAVLDGGLPEWMANKYDVVKKDTLATDFTLGDFKANFQKQFVKTYEDVLANVTGESFQIIDARSAGRFEGTAPEPRKHLKSGCIPNSINIPFKSVLHNGKFKPIDELKEIFQEQSDGSKDLVFSCGSGLTACIILLASEIAFKNSPYVYDGSWTEWAELQGLKK